MELPQMDIVYVSFALFLIATAYQYLRPKEERKYTSLSVEEAMSKIKTGNLYIVDVRRKDEFNKGHIKKAKNVPFEDISNILNKIPKNIEVLVYCETGARSIRAVRYLEVAGYERIFHMHQGLRGWNKAGYPVI
jgi:rhodanese-related sulfurtransferase